MFYRHGYFSGINRKVQFKLVNHRSSPKGKNVHVYTLLCCFVFLLCCVVLPFPVVLSISWWLKSCKQVCCVHVFLQLRCYCWLWNGEESSQQQVSGRPRSWAGHSAACTLGERESMPRCLAQGSWDCTVRIAMTSRCTPQTRGECRWLQLPLPRWANPITTCTCIVCGGTCTLSLRRTCV